MNKVLKTTIDEDGTLTITEEAPDQELMAELKATDRAGGKRVTGYTKYDGSIHGCEKFTAFFNISIPQQVKVTTRFNGKLDVKVNFFNITQNLRGPTLPQNGGCVDLNAGYWKMFFTGSMTKYPKGSSIYATVRYE